MLASPHVGAYWVLRQATSVQQTANFKKLHRSLPHPAEVAEHQLAAFHVRSTKRISNNIPGVKVGSRVGLIVQPIGMRSSSPLDLLLDDIKRDVLPPTTIAASLPSASDLAFERTLSRPLSRQLDTEAARIQSLCSRVIQWSAKETNSKSFEVDGEMVKEGEYRAITEVVEGLFEATDDGIDQFLGSGKHRASETANGTALSQKIQRQELSKGRLNSQLLYASDLPKPQQSFSKRLSLSRPSIEDQQPILPLWKPILRTSLLNSKSLESYPELTQIIPKRPNLLATHPIISSPKQYPAYVHPYAAELSSLKPPKALLTMPSTPIPFENNSLSQTPFEWIDTKDAFQRMIEEFRAIGKANKKELAIDLEHHDYRSWGGLTCLMQISTRKKDYIVDVLDPEVRESMDALNEFLTDREWIKVFHGAHSDVLWLQRDFGIYIVGLFDTYHATHVLGYVQHSLASLLKKIASFEADKRYQLADWRVRPLTEEMLHYARSDTHFLLGIYDHLRLALHAHATKDERQPDDQTRQVSPLEEVFLESTKTASAVFSIPPYDGECGHHSNGWLSLLYKQPGVLSSFAAALGDPTLSRADWGPNGRNLSILKALHRWREAVAREEDENPQYVLPNAGLWAIVFGKPCTGADVIRLGERQGKVSNEVLRRRKEEVAQIVREEIERLEAYTNPPNDPTANQSIQTESESERIGSIPAPEPSLTGDEDPLVAAPKDKAKNITKLWRALNNGSSKPSSISEPTVLHKPSLLFESIEGGLGKPQSQSLISASSSLFGRIPFSDQGPSITMSADSFSPDVPTLSRAAAVAKVHHSLLLGGGLATALQSRPISPAFLGTPEDDATVSSLNRIDLAQVPKISNFSEEQRTLDRNNRKSHDKTSEADIFVVSSLGDKPRKKRKWPKLTENEAKPKESSHKEKEQATPEKVNKKSRKKLSEQERLAPHDYSQSPSILDAEPAKTPAVARSKKEKKEANRPKSKGFEIDTSDFRRQPRVNNQSKKGNVSASFAY